MKKLLFACMGAMGMTAWAATSVTNTFADRAYAPIGFESMAANQAITTGSGDADGGDVGRANAHFFFADFGKTGVANETQVIAYGTGDDDVKKPTLATAMPAFGAADAVNAKGLELSTESGILYRTLVAGGDISDDEGDDKGTLTGTTLVTNNASIYFDSMIQFTPCLAGDTPNLADDEAKFAFWLQESVKTEDPYETETNLMVRAAQASVVGEGDDATITLTPKTYKLSFLNKESAVVDLFANPTNWHRVTVCQYKNVLSEYGKMAAFSVTVDGIGASADVAGFSDSEFNWGDEGVLTGDMLTLNDAKNLFPAIGGYSDDDTAPTTLTAVGFSGTGYIDNIEISAENPAAASYIDFTLAWGLGLSAVDYTVAGKEFSLAELTDAGDVVMKGVASDAVVALVEGSQKTIAGGDDARYTAGTVVTTATSITIPYASEIAFTLAWTASDLTALSYTVGGTETPIDDLSAESAKIWLSDTKTVTVNAAYVDARMADTWTGTKDAVTVADNVFTVAAAGTGMVVAKDVVATYTDAEATEQKAGALADALANVAAGGTVKLVRDATIAVNATTPAGTINLASKTLTADKTAKGTLVFTGTGAKEIKGGSVMNNVKEWVVAVPSGSDLTIDGVTFYGQLDPAVTNNGEVMEVVESNNLLVKNCTFSNKYNNEDSEEVSTYDEGTGTWTDKTYYSFGVSLDGAAKFKTAIFTKNTLMQARRCCFAIHNGETGKQRDVFVYDNVMNGDKFCILGSTEYAVGNKYAAFQVRATGRLFVENNTFTGTNISETVCLYDDGVGYNGGLVVLNGNTIADSVPCMWQYYVKPGSDPTQSANIYFGPNTYNKNREDVEDFLDKGWYKAVRDSNAAYATYEETMVLPTGETCYSWLMGANRDKPYYLTHDAVSSYTDTLAGVAVDDAVIEFPGTGKATLDTDTFAVAAIGGSVNNYTIRGPFTAVDFTVAWNDAISSVEYVITPAGGSAGTKTAIAKSGDVVSVPLSAAIQFFVTKTDAAALTYYVKDTTVDDKVTAGDSEFTYTVDAKVTEGTGSFYFSGLLGYAVDTESTVYGNLFEAYAAATNATAPKAIKMLQSVNSEDRNALKLIAGTAAKIDTNGMGIKFDNTNVVATITDDPYVTYAYDLKAAWDRAGATANYTISKTQTTANSVKLAAGETLTGTFLGANTTNKAGVVATDVTGKQVVNTGAYPAFCYGLDYITYTASLTWDEGVTAVSYRLKGDAEATAATKDGAIAFNIDNNEIEITDITCASGKKFKSFTTELTATAEGTSAGIGAKFTLADKGSIAVVSQDAVSTIDFTLAFDATISSVSYTIGGETTVVSTSPAKLDVDADTAVTFGVVPAAALTVPVITVSDLANATQGTKAGTNVTFTITAAAATAALAVADGASGDTEVAKDDIIATVDDPEDVAGVTTAVDALTADGKATTKQVASWISSAGVSSSDLADMASEPAKVEEAYLFDCKPTTDAITAAEEAFKFTDFNPANPTNTEVVGPDGATYNGTIEIRGATEVGGTYEKNKEGAKFFKAYLVWPTK